MTSTTFQPYSEIPGATATYFMVDSGNTDMASMGDSGGPVFLGNDGDGVVSGTVDSNNVDDMYYTGSNYVWKNGRQILRANDMGSGETMPGGWDRYSFDGRFRLVMQNDGNFVLYKNGGATWATSFYSGFSPVSGSRAVMQGDGNFVVYSPSNSIRWAASWYGLVTVSGSDLVVQDDGNVVIYSPSGSPRWATGTS